MALTFDRHRRPASGMLGALRRVSWVRVVIGADTVRAEVVGVAHRSPVTLPVTMATAAGLARRGVPLSVCREGRPVAAG